MTNFIKGQKYDLEQIKNAFNGLGGNQTPVVVKNGREILYIKFQSKMNPHWETHNEIWIHDGVRSKSDAEQWIASGLLIPVFCGNGRGDWAYLGDCTASALKIGTDARQYTNDHKVEIVLRMNFDNSDFQAVTKSNESQENSAESEPPLYTPGILVSALTRWLMEYPNAVQLDGSSKIQNNPSTYCYVFLCEEVYRLHFDTRRTAIERFIEKVKHVRSAELAFAAEIFTGGKLKTKPTDAESEAGRKSDGWFCYYHRKATRNEIKRAA